MGGEDATHPAVLPSLSLTRLGELHRVHGVIVDAQEGGRRQRRRHASGHRKTQRPPSPLLLLLPLHWHEMTLPLPLRIRASPSKERCAARKGRDGPVAAGSRIQPRIACKGDEEGPALLVPALLYPQRHLARDAARVGRRRGECREAVQAHRRDTVRWGRGAPQLDCPGPASHGDRSHGARVGIRRCLGAYHAHEAHDANAHAIRLRCVPRLASPPFVLWRCEGQGTVQR